MRADNKKARFLARMKKGRADAAKRRAGSRTGNRAATRVTSRRKTPPAGSHKANVTRRTKNTPARSRNAIRQLGTDHSGKPVYAMTVTTKGQKQTFVHGDRKALERLAKNPAGRTSTSSDVRSPTRTATSTEALTSGNSTVTVTGGAGRGATTRVDIHATPRAGKAAVGRVPQGTQNPVRVKNPLRFKSEKEYQAWSSRAGKGRKPAAKKRPAARKRAALHGRRVSARRPATKRSGGKRFKRAGLFSGSGFLGLGRSKQRITARKRPRRRNETPQGIQAIHKKFLGRPSAKSFSATAPKGTPADVAVLGGLVELKTQTEKFGFSDGEAWLAADANGRMYVLGNVRAEPHHDFGDLNEVSYLAVKNHLDNRLIEYFHKFRESGGMPPKLTTDAEGAFHIVGGSYTIEAAGITR